MNRTHGNERGALIGRNGDRVTLQFTDADFSTEMRASEAQTLGKALVMAGECAETREENGPPSDPRIASIQELWEAFQARLAFLPPQYQRVARGAFYAGAASVLAVMQGLMLADDDPALWRKAVELLRDECIRYGREGQAR